MMRGRKRDWPRMVVRRSRPVIGAQRQTVGVRQSGVVPASAAPRAGEAVIGARPWWSPVVIPRRQLIVLAILATLIIVVAGGGVWAWRGPYFKVSNIHVTGAGNRVSATSVLEQADLYNESMFTADLADAQRRIAAMPLVESVKITRSWPHSISIAITQRQPWGTWVQADQDYIIDRHGVVMAEGATAAGTAVINSNGGGSLQVGDRVDYQAVDAAGAIYGQLPKSLDTTISDVSFVTGTGVEVKTANGKTAIFGDSSSIPYKLAVWAAVAQKAEAEHIQYTTIDLRYGNHPVVR